MIVTPDGQSLLVAESAGRRITAFAIGDAGQLTDRRVWADLPDNHYPDGMCLDAQGGVWVACPTAGRFVRVLEGGAVTDCVLVDHGRHAIACVLGGDDRRSLYLLSAATLGEAEESRALQSGRVEVVTVNVPGAGCRVPLASVSCTRQELPSLAGVTQKRREGRELRHLTRAGKTATEDEGARS
jgi:sugar lactone lactonase YvrE